MEQQHRGDVNSDAMDRIILRNVPRAGLRGGHGSPYLDEFQVI
jgi:hypothetical protein